MIRLPTTVLLTLLYSLPLWAEVEIIPLYPGVAPGSENWQETEQVITESGGRETYINVTQPDLRVHLAEADQANGTAVVILPGGGLRQLGMGASNDEMIRFFNNKGISVFVLKYRTLQIPESERNKGSDAGPPADISFPELNITHANANPSPDDPALTKVLELAIQDAELALEIVRSNAERFGVNPDRIGFLGTSAGGGVGLGVYLSENTQHKPDFMISNFGPSLMDVHIDGPAIPLFIATETDHGPVTEGLLELARIWFKTGNPVEMHMFDVPVFQMSPSLWLPRVGQWMQEQKLIPRE